MLKVPWSVAIVIPVAALALVAGCNKSWSLTEVRGKTSFGPEYQQQTNGTHQVRYDGRQGLELRWDSGWTTGVTYRHRWIEEGQESHEDLVLFEVGYPIWKPAKKPEPAKTAERIDELEREVEELREKMAGSAPSEPASSVADAGTNR